MNDRLLEILRCPSCGGALHVSGAKTTHNRIESGRLICDECPRGYSIDRFIPRFVSGENYAKNFGFQWNQFRLTQLDSHTGVPLSRVRFQAETGWSEKELAGRRVLDVGCGAGRFAEIALACGADVVAVDYSGAVDACWQNLGVHPKLSVVQADIYHLPFMGASFDYVYCFGVLQHTPKVREAFLALPAQLKPGGGLTVDVYRRTFLNLLWSKYWLRPLTTRMSQDAVFRLVQAMVRYLFPISLAMGRIPIFGRKLRFAIPVANYAGVFPLSPKQLREWAILDTYDMLTPQHDHPQSGKSLRRWFEEAGLEQVHVFQRGVYVGRGVKPAGNHR